MGFDLFKRKCAAHNLVLGRYDQCPRCVEKRREQIVSARSNERPADPERGALSWRWAVWGSCSHEYTNMWGACTICRASPSQVALTRLHMALEAEKRDRGYQLAD